MHKYTYHHHHSEDRIRSGAKKLKKSKQGATQGRLDSFFKAVPSPASESKRKVCVLYWRARHMIVHPISVGLEWNTGILRMSHGCVVASFPVLPIPAFKSWDVSGHAYDPVRL